MSTAIRATIVWLVLGSFYLFLAGEVSAVEIVAGLLCTSLCTALAVVLDQVAHRKFCLKPPARAVLRPLASLATETVGVGRELVTAVFAPKPHRGGFVRQPFDPGADDDPSSAGRRGLAVLGVSLAPGSLVVRGERSELMILHVLPERAASPDRRWPA